MKVLYIGETEFMPTGMARVSKNIVEQLMKKGYQVVAAYWGGGNNNASYKIYPIPGAKVDALVKLTDFFVNLINSEQINCIVGQGDLFYFLGIERILAITKKPFVGYFNLDSDWPDPQFKTVLDHTAVKLFSSIWARDCIRNEFNILDAEFVYHGVNTDIFKPVDHIKKKNEILFVGQNSGRKDIPSLLTAFSIAVKNGLKSDLCIYSQLVDQFRLPVQASRLGILKRVKFMRTPNFLTDYQLNELYNQALFFATATQGEGFGLPILEAMAAGLPVLAPDHTSLSELVGNTRGKLVKVSAHLTALYDMQLHIVDVEDMAKKMLELEDELLNKSKAVDYMQNCVNFARNHTWDNLGNVLDNAIKKAVSMPVINLPPIEPMMFYISKGLKSDIAVIKRGNVGDYLQLLPVLIGLNRKFGDKPVVFGSNCELLSSFAKEVISTDVDPFVILQSVKNNFKTIYFYVTYYPMIIENGQVKVQPSRMLSIASNLKLDKKMVIDTLIDSSNLRDHCSIDDIKALNELKLPAHDLTEKYIYVGLDGVAPISKKVPIQWITELLYKLRINFPEYKLVLSYMAEFDQIALYPDVRKLPRPDIFLEMSIIKDASLVLSLDNRLVYLSYAFGVPNIALYGPTPAEVFSMPDTIKLTTDQCEPCWFTYTPCLYNYPVCINYVSHEAIIAKIKEVLYGVKKRDIA